MEPPDAAFVRSLNAHQARKDRPAATALLRKAGRCLGQSRDSVLRTRTCAEVLGTARRAGKDEPDHSAQHPHTLQRYCIRQGWPDRVSPSTPLIGATQRRQIPCPKVSGPWHAPRDAATAQAVAGSCTVALSRVSTQWLSSPWAASASASLIFKSQRFINEASIHSHTKQMPSLRETSPVPEILICFMGSKGNHQGRIRL